MFSVYCLVNLFAFSSTRWESHIDFTQSVLSSLLFFPSPSASPIRSHTTRHDARAVSIGRIHCGWITDTLCLTRWCMYQNHWYGIEWFDTVLYNLIQYHLTWYAVLRVVIPIMHCILRVSTHKTPRALVYCVPWYGILSFDTPLVLYYMIRSPLYWLHQYDSLLFVFIIMI